MRPLGFGEAPALHHPGVPRESIFQAVGEAPALDHPGVPRGSFCEADANRAEVGKTEEPKAGVPSAVGAKAKEQERNALKAEESMSLPTQEGWSRDLPRRRCC